MLDDFDPNKTLDAAAKPRALVATALAVAGLGTLATIMVVASQRAPAPPPEVETEVTFEDAPAPEVPEPEEPPPEQVFNDDPRPAAQREALVAPVEIPDEPLAESDAPLEEPLTPSGPTDGIVGGTGTLGGATVRQALGPPPEEEDEEDEEASRAAHFSIEDATAPRLLDGCRMPSFPNDPTLVGQVVRVRCTIGIDGTPTCSVTSGPEAARAAALECAQDRRYEPARYPDGSATPYPKPLTFMIGGS